MAKDTDRLSDLPDHVILSIMSFLKAREAVRTSILSKRWRELWAHLRVVDFDTEEFYSDENGAVPDKFIRFVNMFFTLRRTSDIESFRLSWDYNNTDPEVCWMWIHNAVMCNPWSVNISLYLNRPWEIPGTLFTCTSVEEMELGCCFRQFPDISLTSNHVFFLPSLKRLTLLGLHLRDAFMMKLTSGCPVLEEIVIQGCIITETTISIPILKSLIIKFCKVDTAELCISAPSLLTLQIVGLELGKIWLSDMSSLVTASVSFSAVGVHICKITLYRFLNCLSSVASLELTGCLCDFEAMDSREDKFVPKCRQFKNLKSLYVGSWFLYSGFNLIAWLIYFSPNLQMLAPCYKKHLLLDGGSQKLSVPVQLKSRRFKICTIRDVGKAEDIAVDFVKQVLENFKAFWKNCY